MSDTPSIQLHLLRHAHAGDPEGFDGPDDLRPLSGKGRRQSERLGRFLAETGFQTDALVTSPRLRASQTADLVAERLGIAVTVDARLARPLDLVAIEAILFDLGEPQRPVLVGHDPDFSELVELLTGTTRAPMRKGALARIEVVRPLTAGSGILRWLVPPDLLEAR